MPTPTTTPPFSRQPRPDRPDPTGKDEADSRPMMLTTLVVCALVVVASAFAFKLLPGSGKASDLPADDADEDDTAPYGAPSGPDAVSRLASLSALEPVAPDAARQAALALRDAHGAASAALDAAAAEALLALEGSLAASPLPALPEGYLPGAAVDVELPPSQGYALPRMPAVPGLGGMALGGVQGDPSPVDSRSREVLPLGGLLSQLEGADSALEGLLGDLPVEGLPAGGLDGLPAGLGGLPVGGPSQAQDAGSAVDPDEEGALLAGLHADGMLAATSSAYAQTRANLTGLLAGYQALAGQVEEAVAETRQIEEEAGAAIRSTLDERLADIDAEAVRLEAKADRLVADHARAVAKARGQAEAALQQSLREQAGAVEGAGGEAVAGREARAREVEAQAQARKAEAVALVQAAATSLSGPGAPSDAAQRLAALQSAAATAVAKIDRDAEADVAALEQAALRLESDTRAAVRGLEGAAEKARGQLDAAVAESLKGGLDVKAYLVAVARAQADLAGEREAGLAAEALAKLGSAADEHVEGLVRSGLRSAASASSVLADTASLVGDVEGLVAGEVGKDLEYILKVSEDYGRVPTEDRRERASHWASTAAGIEGVLGDTLAAGQALEALAARAVQAAQQAQAELKALQ